MIPFSTFTVLRGRSRLLLAGAVVTLVAAFVLTLLFRALPADVALDVSSPGDFNPVMKLSGSQQPVTMSRGMALAAPRSYTAEVVALGEKNAEAQSSEVWIHDIKDSDNVQISPEGSWTRRGTMWVSTPDRQPSTMTVTGFGKPSLHFTAHPWSGEIVVRTSQSSERIDLYHNVGRSLHVEVPYEPAPFRFHATVPRGQLSNLSIDLAGLDPSHVQRLYVGTLVPTVFDSRTGGRPHWGRVVEGWNAAPHQGRVSIGPIPAVERGGLVTFLAIASLLGALILATVGAIKAAIVIVRRANLTTAPENGLSPFSWFRWTLFALPFATSMAFAWLAYFPGQPSLDTWYQWAQISNGAVNNHHPAFHSLIIKAMRMAWDSPAVVVLFQILCLVPVLASAFELLRRMNVPRWAIAMGYILTLLSPHTTHMAIAVVKDTPYAAAILGLTVMLGTHLWSTRQAKPAFWIATGVVLALITLFRHNGIMVTVGMALLLPIFFWRERRLAVLTFVTAAVVLLVTLQSAYRILDIHPRDFSHSATSFGWHVGALLDEDVPMAPHEVEFLDQIRPIDSNRWHYTPTSVAVSIWKDYPEIQFDFPFADANLGTFAALHNSLVVRYPLLIVRHLLRANAYLYMPFMPRDLNATIDAQFFLTPHWAQRKRMEAEGHPMRPVLPDLHDGLNAAISKSVQRGPARWLLWMPAHFMYLSILGLALAIRRTGDWRLLLLIIPMLLNTLSLMLGVAQETRFQFPVFLSFGFFCALAALPRSKARSVVEQDAPNVVGMDEEGPRLRTESPSITAG